MYNTNIVNKLFREFLRIIFSKSIFLLWVALATVICAIPSQRGSGQNRDLNSALDNSSRGSDLESEDFGLLTNQIIIKYLDSQDRIVPDSISQLDRLSAASGFPITYVREMSGASHVFRLPSFLESDVLVEVINNISALPEVAYAEPDIIMKHTLTPNDPLYSDQWHYFTPTTGTYGISMPQAWDLSLGSSNVVVAVVDTGITNHVEFFGRTVPGYDFISDVQVANDGDGRDSNPSDPGDWITSAESADGYFVGCPVGNSSWHGSHVAGTIAAASNNGIGVAGINWNAKILPVRVLGKCGGYTSDIVDGLYWAAGLPVPGVPGNVNLAKVINISLGSANDCSTTMQIAINSITAAGATVVTAAGNDDQNASTFQPANCYGVITVAATSKYGDRASYSNYGTTIEISAPGGDVNSGGGVLSTINTGTQGPIGDTYAYYQGTSMAAPHVSGVISLLYGINSSLTPAEILAILQNTATAFPAGSTCNTSICGSGIVNAYSAMDFASPTTPSAPTEVEASDGMYADRVRVTWSASSGATTYKIFRNTSDALPVELESNVPSISYDDMSAAPETHYYYWVQACNTTGCSGYSNYDEGWRSETTTEKLVYLPLIISGTGTPMQPIINGGFELESTGWTEYSALGWDIIMRENEYTVPAYGGEWLAWLGGDDDETSYVSQTITITSGSPYLHYWYWAASEDACGLDYFRVKVGTTTVQTKELCDSKDTGGWVQGVVNLSGHIGTSRTLKFEVITDSSLNSNLFLDDVSLSASASVTGEVFLPAGVDLEAVSQSRME
jgi:serine protease